MTVSTLIVLEEFARIWEKMHTGKVNIEISQKDYQYHWKRAKREMPHHFQGCISDTTKQRPTRISFPEYLP